MISINFDRIYLLFIAIPLLVAIIVPYAIAIRKDNRTKSVVASLILHILIVICVTFSASGTEVTTVITETNVVVVADVSYSSSRNLSVVDGYVKSVKKSLPDNSKVSIVAFGRDYKQLTNFGENLVSVKNSGVDDSATDIKGALEYASTLFPDEVVKRIVLITDGKQTDKQGSDGLVGTISYLRENNIYIDAIFLDNNVKSSDNEVQISDVDYTRSTYLNHEASARVLVQSASDFTDATVSLYLGDKKIAEKYPSLMQGYNLIDFPLSSDETGTFHYKVVVETANASGDFNDKNNEYTFTQTITDKVKVLLVTTKESDVTTAQNLYGANAEIVSYVNTPNVPFSVESLMQYDEIILSDFDVRTLNNYTSFIKSLDRVVSEYGKSLVTMGDTCIQNHTDDVLMDLENMLPVKYGNSDHDPRLLAIVIDNSRSMESAYRFQMAKSAAIQMLQLLNDTDYVTVVAFAGDHSTVWRSSELKGNRTNIENAINAIPLMQGTVLGKGMLRAKELVLDSVIEDKQIMLISDGRTYTEEVDDPLTTVAELASYGIKTSVINTNTFYDSTQESLDAIALLQNIASTGDGNYYFVKDESDLTELILTDIAEEITESIVNKVTKVKVNIASDEVLNGVEDLPTLNGYIHAKAKPSATTVLTTEYVKTSGLKVDVPIYSYWGYGDGKVSSFTSSLSGVWSENWMDGSGANFFKNVVSTSIPSEKHDYSFNATIENEYDDLLISVTPSTLNYDATLLVNVKMPNGQTVSKQVPYSVDGYYYSFKTSETGKYEIELTYNYPNRESEVVTLYYDVAYFAEYDSFTYYNVYDLHKIIRANGNVYTNGDIKFETDENDVATYSFYLTAPLMIAAVVLFIIDILVRTLKKADFVNMFKKRVKNSDKKENK